MGRDRVRDRAAAELLTAAELSRLYGVRVSTVDYDDGGSPGRTVVAHFEVAR